MNMTLALVRYAVVEGKGWRRGAAVLTRNGKLKADVMMINGIETSCPTGRFQLRRYEGKRPVYMDLGNDPADALARFRSEDTKSKARTKALAAGLELADDNQTARKSLKQYAKAFLRKHENTPHRSDDSLRVYRQVTDTFLGSSTSPDSQPEITNATYPNQVTEDEIIEWHAWIRRNKGYSARTCANHYVALRAFLTYCGLDLRKLIPSGTHKKLKEYTKTLPNKYSPEQVAVLVAASADENQALLWDFGYKTGLRESELQMVTRDDLYDLDGSSPMLHVKERDAYGQIKDAEERQIELHSSLLPKLRAWLKEYPTKTLLFGTETDLPDTKMLKALKRTARRAGLNCGHCRGCRGKNRECAEFTLHRFRRTFVTRLLKATGGDLGSVMLRSGHSDMAP